MRPTAGEALGTGRREAQRPFLAHSPNRKFDKFKGISLILKKYI
jgi:hypothetical protein